MKHSKYPYPKICPALTENQCNEILKFALTNKGVEANVLDLDKGHYRDKHLRSATSWSLPEELEASRQIRSFIESQSGLPRVHQDGLTLLRYEVGDHHAPHYDFVTYENSDDDEGGGGAERLYTALIWLNDDFKGGETSFINLNIKYRGKTGEGILWMNVDPVSGAECQESLHAGLPVEQGEKWVVVTWVMDRPVRYVDEATRSSFLQEVSGLIKPELARSLADFCDKNSSIINPWNNSSSDGNARAMWISLPNEPEILAMRRLISDITKLPVTHQEPAFLVSHDVGASRHLSTDSFGREQYKIEEARGGHRVYTVYCPLQEADEGGELMLPSLGNSWRPKYLGDALVWQTARLKRPAIQHPLSIHEILKVRKGTQIVLYLWIRERPFDLRGSKELHNARDNVADESLSNSHHRL